MSSTLVEMKALDPGTVEGFVSGVRLLAEGRILKALSQSTSGIDVKVVMPGKMLRTRLAGRLCDGGWSSVDHTTLQAACAATELVHTASTPSEVKMLAPNRGETQSSWAV